MEELTMKDSLTRKDFLKDATKYTAGVALSVAAVNALTGNLARALPAGTPWPWPYAQLDIEKVRKAGHDAFWTGKGCSYGAFHALVSELRTLVGEPYVSLPTEVMIYGHGGGVGWGTLCGALNGAAALISLVCTKERSDIIINELMGWYTQTNFPTDISNQYGANSQYGDNRYTQTLPQNMSGSVLCHVSVTEWCKAANTAVGDTKRKERCARLTGDVAAQAAKLLNDEFQGRFAAQYVAPQSVTVCGTCHGSTGSLPYTAVKMECVQCHGNKHNTLTKVATLGSLAVPTFQLTQNYPNPFNPETTIEFTLPVEESVTLSIYDLNGRLVKHLIAGEPYSKGTFRVAWDGTDDMGKRVASGMYFARMRAGSYVGTIKMNLIK